MSFVFFISSNAFAFLGLDTIFWISAYAFAIMRISMLFPQYVSTLRRNWVFFLFPSFAFISVLWSDVPAQSLRYSAQLFFTIVIGTFIGMRFTLFQIAMSLAGVLFFCIVMSLINLTGVFQPAYDHRNNFKGIFISKNALGHRAVLFAATCFFGIFLFPKVKMMTRLCLVFGLLVNVFLISISGSATAVALSGVLVMVGIFLWLLLGVRKGWVVIALLIFVPMFLCLFWILATGQNPITFVLGLLGRDPTLTGRTVLWAFAIDHIGDRPWLGYGAKGFWNHPLVQGRIALLQARYGDGVNSFHNLVLELLIMFGPIGLALHTLAMTTTITRAANHVRRYSDRFAAWALTLTVGMYIMAMINPQLFQQHAIPFILVVVFGVCLSQTKRPGSVSHKM